MSRALLQSSDALIEACGDTDPAYSCEKVFEWTDNTFLAKATEWILDRPIHILLILLSAWILSKVFQRVVRRFVATVTASPTDTRLHALRERGPVRLRADPVLQQRATARAETLQHVLRGVVAVVVWTVAFLLVLGGLDVDLAPLIAGAGIGGIALGFGAQSIVKDFLAGLFMLMEDQYGVGDTIDVGEATGTVERVSLRATTLRDVYGTVWHVPNGEIVRVANFSQLWSRALLDVEVAYDTDLTFAQGVIQRVADDLWEDPAWRGDVMERPEVWGVQDVAPSSVTIRLVVKTEPSQQWAVERELRLRLKVAFDEAGIESALPQQTVWFRNQGDHPMASRPDPETIETHQLAQAHDDDAVD